MGAASVARPPLGVAMVEGDVTAVGAVVAGVGVNVAGTGAVVVLGFVVAIDGAAVLGVVEVSGAVPGSDGLKRSDLLDEPDSFGAISGVDDSGFDASRIGSARSVL